MSTQQKIVTQLGLKPELHLIFEGYNQKGSIYLSNFVTALHSNLLNNHEISSILTVAKGCWIQQYMQKTNQQKMKNSATEKSDQNFQNQKNKRIKGKSYLYIPLTDKITTNIRKHFDKIFQFIDHSRTYTNILIHCKAGVSRSATIIIAYLMNKYHYNIQQAYLFVKNSCPKIKPNIGFIKQLIDYNIELFGSQFYHDMKLNTFFSSDEKQRELVNDVKKGMGAKEKLCKLGRLLDKDREMLQNKISKIKKSIETGKNVNINRSEFLNSKINKWRQKYQIKYFKFGN